VRTALSPLSTCDRLAVHFDVDLVDFLDAPLAENTDRGAAPSLTACGEMLSELLTDTHVRALTVTEFKPHHGAQDESTTQRLLEILVSCLGETEQSAGFSSCPVAGALSPPAHCRRWLPRWCRAEPPS